jgi:Na+/H+-dicarboxylate symporter
MLVATLALACIGLMAGLLIVVHVRTGLRPFALLQHFRDEMLIIAGTSSSGWCCPA